MSIEEFSTEDQPRLERNRLATEQIKSEFISHYLHLVRNIRKWLSKDVSRGRTEIHQSNIGNVQGDPPTTTIQTADGTITFTPDCGPFIDARGYVKAECGNRTKGLVLKYRWYITDRKPNYQHQKSKQQPPEYGLLFNEQNFVSMINKLLEK